MGIRHKPQRVGLRSETNAAARNSHDSDRQECGSRHSRRVVASCGDLTANSLRDALARYSAQYAADPGNAEAVVAAEHAGSVAGCRHSFVAALALVAAVCSDSAFAAALAVAAFLGSVAAERAVVAAAALAVAVASDFDLVGVAPVVHDCFDSGVAAFPGSVAAERAADKASLAPPPFAAA